MEVVEPEDVVEAEPLLVTPQGLRERRRHIDHPQLAALGQALLLGGRVCWISQWRPWYTCGMVLVTTSISSPSVSSTLRSAAPDSTPWVTTPITRLAPASFRMSAA